ncbi:MAG: kelch repeat-containing protein [Sandaracinaceae bacterium]|nr:kelch repeat-containing protein [Sandaracinaceae bacterium]
MAWAPGAEALYLFGGGGTAGFSADTYRYGAGAWTRLEASGPLARYDAVMLPSSSEDALLLFGGSYGATGAAFYADLWRFDVASESWSEVALPEGPGGRRIAWVVRDPDRGGLYVGFGYDGDMQPLGDLWYADLDALAWAEIALPDDRPASRGFAPALPGGEAALGTARRRLWRERPHARRVAARALSRRHDACARACGSMPVAHAGTEYPQEHASHAHDHLDDRSRRPRGALLPGRLRGLTRPLGARLGRRRAVRPDRVRRRPGLLQRELRHLHRAGRGLPRDRLRGRGRRRALRRLGVRRGPDLLPGLSGRAGLLRERFLLSGGACPPPPPGCESCAEGELCCPGCGSESFCASGPWCPDLDCPPPPPGCQSCGAGELCCPGCPGTGSFCVSGSECPVFDCPMPVCEGLSYCDCTAATGCEPLVDLTPGCVCPCDDPFNCTGELCACACGGAEYRGCATQGQCAETELHCGFGCSAVRGPDGCLTCVCAGG